MRSTPSPVTNCHTFSDPLPIERDVLYGRPLGSAIYNTSQRMTTNMKLTAVHLDDTE